MALVDGVQFASDVRRRVLMQTTPYKQLLRTYNPEKHSAAVLVRKETQWMGEVKERFDALTEALVGIEMDEDATQGDVDDATKILEAMAVLQEDFVTRYEAKCEAEPAVQIQPAAGLFPGLQIPAPLTNAVSNAQSLASAASEQSLAKRAQNSVTVESKYVKEKIQEIHTEFTKVRNWSDAEDHVVELEMTKVKGWKERMNALKEKIKTIEIKCLDHDLDMTPFTTCKHELDSAVAELEFVIEQMEHEDTERGLYSLNPGKAANLSYPTFSGSDSEDYFKFKKEMENCFRGNRIRREDQVTVLKKELKGDALKLLPSNVTSIATAWDLLNQIYGDPKRILLNRKAKIKAMTPFYKLDKFGGNAGRTAGEAKQMVDWCVAMELVLEDLFAVAKKSVDMNNSVFSEDLYSTVSLLLSANIIGVINKEAGSYKEKLEALYKFVKDKKEELKPFLAQTAPSTSSSKDNSSQSDIKANSRGRFSGFSGGGRNRGGSSDTDAGCLPIAGCAGFTSFKRPQRFDSCRVCKLLDKEGTTSGLYEEHLTDNVIGCPVFALMDVETRLSYARRAKLCLHCLDGEYVWKPSTRHVDCVASERKNKRWYFSCSEPKCSMAFHVCASHKDANKEKLEKTSKWWKDKGKSFVYTASMSSSAPSVSVAAPGDSRPPPTALTAHESDPVVTRRLEDVAPPGPPISPPPAGEPLFMMSYAKGRTSPVLVFYDDGCSHLLAKEGIPGDQLTGVKLREGPL